MTRHFPILTDPTPEQRVENVARLKRLDSREGHVIVAKDRSTVVRIYGPSTKQLCDVYMRGLKENNPGIYATAVILPPRTW
jgi:hypothetical protein